MINTIVNFTQHVDRGLAVSGRVRVASLRAFPMTTAPKSVASGQKCALMDQALVIDGYRLVAGVAATTGAFPGTSAWSPPI